MGSNRRAKRASPGRASRPTGKEHCLNILRQLSDYLDQDLDVGVCDEIRRHLGVCPNCETFVVSLRQTVSLCRHSAPPSLSSSAKVQLRQRILQAVGRGK